MARTLNSLGVCVYSLGRVKEAEELHKQALDIREAKLAADHPDVAKILRSLEACGWEASLEKANASRRQAPAVRKGTSVGGFSDKASTLYSIEPCISKGK